MVEKRKQKIVKKILSILMLGFFVFGSTTAFAQEGGEGEGEPPLYEPIEKQVIQLTDEGEQDNWNISSLETHGLKFLVRGKEALTWSLSIEDGGFHNEAIETSYIKVLTIVNSLFILGLLAIAIMWMFSIIIPRKYLKKVILVYSLAVVFINFALPVNQVLIDGTNLLQKTLLTESDGSIEITDIVQTPPYTEVLSYQSNADESLINGKQTEAFTLKLDGADEETTSIGKIRVQNGEDIDEEMISLNNQTISLIKDTPFSIHQEQILFRFSMLLLTGIAYFIIALIFVLRIVILWALLILSPILLLLAIFRSTRGWFFNWLGLYGRWLLIGPLAALGIAVIVNIWQLSGLPISVSDTYSPELFSAEKTSNIVFYLPGKETGNTLSNTQEMMEYIIFLIMLYLPIIMAFALTRQKYLQGGLVVVREGISKMTQAAQKQLSQQNYNYTRGDEEKREKPGSLLDNFRFMLSNRIGSIANAAMPIHKMKVKPETPTQMMPTASNFLPENLVKTPVPKMLELLGMQKGSKSSHRKVIEKLARVERIESSKEKEKVMSVMNEIESRAGEKNKEALAILHEVETVKEVDARNVDSNPIAEVHVNSEGGTSGNGANININVNDSKPETDRKVRDRSFDSKNGEKGKKQNEKKTKEDKKVEKESGSGEKSEEKPNANPEENAN